MLAFSFFALIFSSLLWLMYSVLFVSDTLNGISLFDAGAANVIIYILLICAPIFLIWAVFGYVNQYLQNRLMNTQLRKLMGQMKKNQDYSDLIARALIETEQQVKDGFVLNRFDLLISDMNELLSEIIKGCKLASIEQIEALWAKVQNGGKWSFGKVIIEVNNAQPDFKKRILDKAILDSVLSGTIMEFCARYSAIVKMLEKHDQDKVFLEMIETGVMGKVYSILSPVSMELQRGREAITGFNTNLSENATSVSEIVIGCEDKNFSPLSKTSLPDKIFNKISLFGKKKNQEQSILSKDEFSLALERSFRSEEPQISLPEETQNEDFPKIEIPQVEETDTQKALSGLKKEWSSDFSVEPSLSEEQSVSREELPSNLAYPFGNWSDEQNYQK